MARCVTCGDELHPERAEKYDYCTKPECQKRNGKGLRMVAVGVNKAADQYVVLNERTEKEMAVGRYKKRPEAPGSVRTPSQTRRYRTSTTLPTPAPRSSTRTSPPRWSDVQGNLAVIYRAMGMKPDEIAKKLGVSRYLVIQMLLSATAQRKR
jgi:DNA-directed RNA polymerase subunit N (RpoN/RPB10)